MEVEQDADEASMVDGRLKSKFRGVTRCGSKWKAQLYHAKTQVYLGIFDTAEEAARTYELACSRLNKAPIGEHPLLQFSATEEPVEVAVSQDKQKHRRKTKKSQQQSAQVPVNATKKRKAEDNPIDLNSINDTAASSSSSQSLPPSSYASPSTYISSLCEKNIQIMQRFQHFDDKQAQLDIPPDAMDEFVINTIRIHDVEIKHVYGNMLHTWHPSIMQPTLVTLPVTLQAAGASSLSSPSFALPLSSAETDFEVPTPPL